MAGGCRGCHARNEWPGHEETTAHAIHNCPGKEVRDLIAWRGDVAKKLKGVLKYVERIGRDAVTLRMQIQGALGAISLRHPRGERYNALTNTVGGALAWWDDRHEENDKKHNKTLTSMVVGVQCLFIERVQ